jgi:hypothetical protein
MANTQTELIRRGVELFNQGDYYGCHEVFEEAWMDESGSQRLFLQGLIQVAVALHHLTQHNAKGATRLLAEGLQKLREHQQAQPWVAMDSLRAGAGRVLDQLQSGLPVSLGPDIRIDFVNGSDDGRKVNDVR